MSMDELEKQFEELVSGFSLVSADEIPDIDLYMDQVTTFMEQKLSDSTRDPGKDKILTKTMINNYAKNSLLVPPVKKKYGMDHLLLLLMIFYMKSFLSISDIEAVLAPVRDRYVAKQPKKKGAAAGKTGDKKEEAPSGAPSISLKEIYSTIEKDIDASLPQLREDTKKDFEAAEKAFADAPEEDRQILQKFDLICRLSGEIYIKKLFIERLIDEDKKEK